MSNQPNLTGDGEILDPPLGGAPGTTETDATTDEVAVQTEVVAPDNLGGVDPDVREEWVAATTGQAVASSEALADRDVENGIDRTANIHDEAAVDEATE